MASDPGLQKPLINVNISDVTKLSSLNYLTWRIEMEAILRRNDLMEFIDESTSPPPVTNPAFILWQAQDCLIHSALIDTIETPQQALIIAATSMEAWKTLASTYGKENEVARKMEEEEEEDTLNLLQALKKKHQQELRLGKETDYLLAIEQERIEKLELKLQNNLNEYDNMCLQAQSFESKYNSEAILRKESEIALEEIKQLQDDLTSQITSWQNKYEKELSLRKKTERALSIEEENVEVATTLLETYNKETDAMREEKDNALKILDEITTKQQEERQALYTCPITQEFMKDPQIAADGYTYEAEAIKEWLSTGKETSPMTSLKLPNLTLVPNRALRSSIKEWV